MTTMTTTTILRAAVETARREWTGITWSTTSGEMASALRLALVEGQGRDHLDPEDDDARGRRERAIARLIMQAVDETSGNAWPMDGSYDSQELDRRLGDLTGELVDCDGDATTAQLRAWVAEAESLHEEEERHVSGMADAAAEHGQAAIAADAAGDTEMAIEELEAACSDEREFGDAPAWEPVLVAYREAVSEAEDARASGIYMVCDGNGDALTDGLQGEDEARRVAQRMADDRGESVWVSLHDDEGMGEEIRPDRVSE